jgi:hypothetical protein
MKRGRNNRRRVPTRCFHPDEIADRPPQRRARAELERVERILESLPTKADKDERPA